MILETLFDADIEDRKKSTNEQVYLDLEKSDLEKIETYSEKFFEELKKAFPRCYTSKRPATKSRKSRSRFWQPQRKNR